MPRDPRKHQKKKERRNQREKEKRKLASSSQPFSPYDLLAKVANQPFGICKINAVFRDTGIGNLLVSRGLPNGKIVCVVFLVDIFCLGIKNVTCQLASAFEIQSIAREMFHDGGSQSLSPEEALKLCDGAVAFAAKYDLKPHPEYAKAKAIFAGVDDSTYTTEFSFGKDGKPFYICGPHDSRTFQRRILDTLTRTAGPGQFDYVLAMTSKSDAHEFLNEETDEMFVEEFDEMDDPEDLGDVYEMTDRGIVMTESNRTTST